MSTPQVSMRLQAALRFAQRSAGQRGHRYVETEHILLGVLDAEGVACAAIEAVGVDIDELRTAVFAATPPTTTVPIEPAEPLYTGLAKKSVDRAIARAKSLGHGYVGVEHMLLGIAAERSSESSRLLAERGATLDRLDEAVSRLLGMS